MLRASALSGIWPFHPFLLSSVFLIVLLTRSYTLTFEFAQAFFLRKTKTTDKLQINNYEFISLIPLNSSSTIIFSILPHSQHVFFLPFALWAHFSQISIPHCPIEMRFLKVPMTLMSQNSEDISSSSFLFPRHPFSLPKHIFYSMTLLQTSFWTVCQVKKNFKIKCS